MASLTMNGPFLLTKEAVDKLVLKNSIGNYALGYSEAKVFIVRYVGRSDTDLNGRLKEHVGQYEQFKFSNAQSAKEAYAKELRNYNDFGGSDALDNEIEPAKP